MPASAQGTDSPTLDPKGEFAAPSWSLLLIWEKRAIELPIAQPATHDSTEGSKSTKGQEGTQDGEGVEGHGGLSPLQ